MEKTNKTDFLKFKSRQSKEQISPQISKIETKSTQKLSWLKKIDKFLEKYQSIKRPELIFFTKNLYLLIKVGVPLAESLSTMAAAIKNKRLQTIILHLGSSVEKGLKLSEILNQYPKVFSHYYRSMIEVGEISGTLDNNINNIAEQEMKDYELIKKVRGAMIYPIVILCTMVCLGIGVFIFVIPNFIDIFQDLDAKLPLATQILLDISNFLVKYGIFVVLAIVGVVIILIRALKNEKFQYYFHLMLLKIPIIGKIIMQVNILRFSRALHSLIRTDIKIEQAFKITAKTLSNSVYKKAIDFASQEIEKGESIANALATYPFIFPLQLTQIISVAENTGALENTLMETATFYEMEVDSIMKNLSSIIEPLLILFLGVGVALMAVAIVMPMYSLSAQMSI